MFFCSVYFYPKPNEKAAGSASYAARRGGEEGEPPQTHPGPLLQQLPNSDTEHPLWGINSSILSLLMKQQVNLGSASKWLLLPVPQEKKGFQQHSTRTSRFPRFHLISVAGKVRSHPQVLLWQKPWTRTEGFYSNCFQRKIQTDSTAALFTRIFEMLVMKGLSLTPSHSPHKNWSPFVLPNHAQSYISLTVKLNIAIIQVP